MVVVPLHRIWLVEIKKKGSSPFVSVEFTGRTKMDFVSRSCRKHCDFGVKRQDDETSITSQHLRLSSDSLAAVSGTETEM